MNNEEMQMGKKGGDTLKINDDQRQYYGKIEEESAEKLSKDWLDLIDFGKLEQEVFILDVGGASGFFSRKLLESLKERGLYVSIYIIDTTEYPTWYEKQTTDSGEIMFIKDSVENIDKIVKDVKFDLIFCNRVVHHLVTGGSYKSTAQVIDNCMKKLHGSLKATGQLCILDHFYDGFLIDSFPSEMIYWCTSCKIPLLMRIFKKMGAESAGCGVFFLSEKMWGTLMEKCGFNRITLQRSSASKTKLIYKIAFLLRNRSWDNYMIFCK